MPKSINLIGLILLASLFIQACKKEVFDTTLPPVSVTNCENIVFDTSLSIIFETKCITCHYPGGTGPGDFSVQSVLTSYLPKINQRAILDRTMPSSTYPQLTDNEYDKLKNWIDCGGQFQPIKELTYAKDIKSIIDVKCLYCHEEGTTGPGDFNKTEDVKTIVDNGKFRERALTQKTMPPYGYEQLTPAEIDILTKWLDQPPKF